MDLIQKLIKTRSFLTIVIFAIMLLTPIIIQSVSYWWGLAIFTLAAIVLAKTVNRLKNLENNPEDTRLHSASQVSERDPYLPFIKDFNGHFNLGVAYMEMGLLQDAIDEFKVAIEVDPSQKDKYDKKRIEYLANIANLDVSYLTIENIDINEADKLFLQCLVDLFVYLEKGEQKKAISSLEKACELQPENKKIKKLLEGMKSGDNDIHYSSKNLTEASVFMAYDLHDRALELINKVLKTDPENKKALSMKKKCEITLRISSEEDPLYDTDLDFGDLDLVDLECDEDDIEDDFDLGSLEDFPEMDYDFQEDPASYFRALENLILKKNISKKLYHKHFELGFRLLEKKSYIGARTEFEKAAEAVPSARGFCDEIIKKTNILIEKLGTPA